MLRRLVLLTTLAFFVLVLVSSLQAQIENPSVIYVSVDPSGACGNGVMQYNYTTGNFWGCENGIWSSAGGTGGGGGGGGGGGLPPGAPANQILSGCGVEYTSGLSFTVGACTYAIGGQTYTSPIVTLTLGSADPSNPRIDAIIVDITSVASVLPGVAASSPAQPTIDPSTQLLLTFALVAANATTPSNVTVDNIYDENTEWTCTASAHFNCASTSNPYQGTKDIEFTAAVLNNNVTLVKPAAGTVDLATRNTLIFYLRSKAIWPTGANGATAARSLAVWWQNGSTQKGLQVIVKSGVFGFSSSSTAAYQQIAIPTSLFGANGLPVTTLKFNISGPAGSSSIGGYIDDVTLQGGLNPPALPTTLMNFRGTYSTTTAYNPNDVACGATGLCYVALLANTNVAQNTTADWQPTTPVIQTYRACVIDNDTQSSTALTAAQFSGGCQVPQASHIVEIDTIGSTLVLNGTPASFTYTGAAQVAVGLSIPGSTSTTDVMSALLVQSTGVACSLPAAGSATCPIMGITQMGASQHITTTAIPKGNLLYVSAAVADTPTHVITTVWYTVD